MRTVETSVTADSNHSGFRLPIAPEGLREIALSTLVLGGMTWLSVWLFWPAAIPFVVVWLWVLSFFRDPRRERTYGAGDLCSPADGTVTAVTELPTCDGFDGPAVRIGIFLSLFNVHVNRSPCSGIVRTTTYKPGGFLDARHPDSGRLNESNTVLIDPDGPIPGPIVVRQVAGLVARRIICHAKSSDRLGIGERFGLIKFGSRTELIIPKLVTTEILVGLGQEVRAGLTILARQPAAPELRGEPRSSGRGAAHPETAVARRN